MSLAFACSSRLLRLPFTLGLFAVMALPHISRCAAKTTAVQITVREDIVLVPLHIPPAKRLFTFVLDTGAEITMLDRESVRSLNLAPGEGVDVQTVSSETPAETTVLPVLQVGRQRISGMRVAVLDLMPMTNSLGIKVDGVLGIDAIQRFSMTINYSKRELLLEPSEQARRSQPRDGIPVHFDKGGCIVPVSLNGQPGAELLLDTGTNMTQLTDSIWRTLLSGWHPEKLITGVASGGLQNGKSSIVRLQSLQLGGYTVSGPVVRIWPQETSGTFSEEGAPGLLASDVLRRFVVTLDLSHQRLWLVPDPDYKPDPFEFTSVGIQFARRGKAFYVASVWEGSPAARAGISRGDQILEVEGQPSTNLTKESLARLLHGPAGSAVSVVIQRGSRVFTLPLRREELL